MALASRRALFGLGLSANAAAEGKGFLFPSRGDVALRGFEGPVRLYEVHWREED
jgi:class 3 adenylate cyclase